MRVLTINSGSSSIKFSLYDISVGESLLVSGKLDRISLSDGTFTAKDSAGRTIKDEPAVYPSHDEALKALFDLLSGYGNVDAVGHRVVHGGMKYTSPQIIDAALMEELYRLIPFATEHLPHEIKAIEAVWKNYPKLKQVACFDTAFHRGLPKLSEAYALPEEFRKDGIIKYGFHGLSYEFIVSELGNAAKGKVIIAHLGNGASMAAIKDGRPIDTTMGFTPVSGLVMSTRTGDLDPGAIIYMMKEKGLTADEVNVIINKKSGLLGVSGVSSDMKDLLSKENADPKAAFAIELFSYAARKYIGAFSAALGGLDTLVFTGGMGENSPEIRKRICKGLEFLGIEIGDARNLSNAPVISKENARASVRVIKTNEELMIARHTARVASKNRSFS